MTAPNWANRTMWTGDNHDIMRGMNSASLDPIYLDPLFNSNRNYAAPMAAARPQAIGSKAAGAGLFMKREEFLLGELVINYAERRVSVAGRAVALTATEYALLSELSNQCRSGYDPRPAPAAGLG